jgi:Reeler domain
MQVVSSRIVFIKLTVIAFASVLAMFCFVNFSDRFEKVSASASGPTPSVTNAPNESNCTACHTSFPLNSGTGSVLIAGVPVNYLPNQTIPVTVTTSQSDAVIYGFQLTAIDSQGKNIGTFKLPTQSPAQLQTVTGIVNGNQRTYVEHTSSGVIPTQFGSKSWTFNWSAPAQRVGKISFYAAGNAANSDGSTVGDYIYTTNKSTLFKPYQVPLEKHGRKFSIVSIRRKRRQACRGGLRRRRQKRLRGFSSFERRLVCD